MAASVPMMNRPTNTMSSTPAVQQQKLVMTVFHWRISSFVFIVVPTPTTSRLALTLPRGAMPAVVTISVGRPHQKPMSITTHRTNTKERSPFVLTETISPIAYSTRQIVNA